MEKIQDWLPGQIIDVHTHIWPISFSKKVRSSRLVSWPDRVAKVHPLSHLLETYRLLFPHRKVTPLVFATVPTHRNLDRLNQYVSRVSRKNGLPALIFSSPRWSSGHLEEAIIRGNFLGAKSYLSLAPAELKPEEIRIYDFFPVEQLQVLNQHGWILMLHLPRPDRLRDPVNLRHLLEIDKRYPRMKTIVAHVGRAYCDQDAGSAFRVLKETRHLYFDISANTNEHLFRQLIEAVGPARILFGSDLPVTRMRMRRICEQGRYINLVPAGLYGDVSGDPHLREVTGQEASSLTFFLYEEIISFLKACHEAGLTREEIRAVFHDNAASLLQKICTGSEQQLQMVWPEGKVTLPTVNLPSKFRLRTFRSEDADAYCRLMRRAGFSGWNQVAAVLERALPEGVFFVENRQGRLVATACALHHPGRLHPSGGELGWVAVDPVYRRQGLGTAVCLAAVKRLLQAGYRRIYLLTDDWRLAAIKTYLRLGFFPFCYRPGMKPRWQEVARQLNMSLLL